MHGESPFPKWEITGVLPQTKLCPRFHAEQGSAEWIEVYAHYQSGHLWCEGGISVQPALFMQVMRLIEVTARQATSGSKG